MSSEKYAHILMVEKRIMLSAILVTAICFILWIIAVSTNYWFILRAPKEGLYLNNSKTYFIESHSGLWQICTTESKNMPLSSDPGIFSACENHKLAPTRYELRKDPEIDKTILHYSKTETAFSIISVIMMIMALGFSLYTFVEHRYTFKRLAGGVYFIAGGSVLVVIEVVIHSVHYEAENLPDRHPKGSEWSFGFSLYFAWVVFASQIAAGFAFMACSRKRKEVFMDHDHDHDHNHHRRLSKMF